MQVYTKDSLKQALVGIRDRGWVPNRRPGNDGGVGNTLEDLLGIPENNLPLPNAAEWELKCQRAGASSLQTLFHMEPSPRTLKIVSQILLPKYGWRHAKAGGRYPDGEMSFRQTIHGQSRSDRGFMVVVNSDERKIEVSFDAQAVDPRHADWLESVRSRAGLSDIAPRPYWGFDDLFHKAGTKLHNTFFALADRKRENETEYFRYSRFYMLQGLRLDNFILAIAKGDILIDFDARTGHNHGTKFRLRRNKLADLYESVEEIG